MNENDTFDAPKYGLCHICDKPAGPNRHATVTCMSILRDKCKDQREYFDEFTKRINRQQIQFVQRDR